MFVLVQSAEGRGAVAPAAEASDSIVDKDARTGRIDWQLADLSGTGHLAALGYGQREQADRIFMQRRPWGEGPDLPRTGVERYGHSRETSAVATCSVGSLTSASRGRGLTGKPVTESNLSPRAPAQVPADLRSFQSAGVTEHRAHIRAICVGTC